MDPNQQEKSASVFIDTIYNLPYSNPLLSEILEIDSIFMSVGKIKSNKFEITTSESSELINEKLYNLIQFNIYNKEWVTNKVGIFAEEIGTIYFISSNPYKKFWLRAKIKNNKTIFELHDTDIEALKNNTILFPVPPIPDSIPIIEIF